MIRSDTRRGLSRTAVIVIIVVSVCLVLVVSCAGIFGMLMVPSLTKAREMARMLKSEVQAMQIAQATLVSQNENDDNIMEISFDQLIADNWIDPSILLSPLGPVSDGRGDYWSYPDPIDLDAIVDPDALVIIYDRAAYESHDMIPVAFLSGYNDVIQLVEFNRLITQPPNGGVDYDLPARAP